MFGKRKNKKGEMLDKEAKSEKLTRGVTFI